MTIQKIIKRTVITSSTMCHLPVVRRGDTPGHTDISPPGSHRKKYPAPVHRLGAYNLHRSASYAGRLQAFVRNSPCTPERQSLAPRGQNAAPPHDKQAINLKGHANRYVPDKAMQNQQSVASR